MLVLSRQRDESVMIGPAELEKLLSPEEMADLKLAAEDQGAMGNIIRKLTLALSSPITATIIDIRGDKVRIGFDASIVWPIHREEVYKQIHREPRAASQVTSSNQKAISQ